MTTAVFGGDSMVAGFGGVGTEDTYRKACSARMGWTQPWHVQYTGFVTEDGLGQTAIDYVAEFVALDPAPDFVMVEGGINDPDAGFAAAVDAFFPALRVLVPAATIIAIGTHVLTNLRRDALEAAALSVGGLFINWAPWLTGTGYVGNEQNDGNRDIYIGPDGIHPTQAGHDYLGGRIAYELGNNRVTGITLESGVPLMLEVPA